MSSEKAILMVQAMVMVYDNNTKAWSVEGQTEGNSKIQIFHHTINNTYRVIARKLCGHELVINSAILKSTKYNKATETFHQWRDKQVVYGLNFLSTSDADSFGHAFESVLSLLNSAQTPVSILPPPNHQTTISHTTNNLSMDDSSVQNRANQAPCKPYGTMKGKSSQPNIPHSPPSQPPPSQPPPSQPPPSQPLPTQPPPTQSLPPVGMPSAGGVPPPPPPPPPPPGPPMPAPSTNSSNGGGDEGGMSGLAAALAGAKLKKAANKESGTGSGATGGGKSGGGGGGGMDMMSEMAKRLQMRKVKSEAGGRESPSSNPQPSSLPLAAPTPQSKSKTPSNWTAKSKVSSGNHLTKTSTTSVPNLSENASTVSSCELETIKQVILQEMREEMKKMKEEIINVIRQELSAK